MKQDQLALTLSCSYQRKKACSTIFFFRTISSDLIYIDVCVARLRTIFSLSEKSKSYLNILQGDYTKIPSHLAYVEPYHMNPERDPISGMHQLQKGNEEDAFIIPLAMILDSAHLIPIFTSKVFGTHTNWTKDTVLDLSSQFLLNSYKDYKTHYLMR